MSRKIGYARVSTQDQNSDLQIDALKLAGCDKIFCDDGISGSLAKRPALDETLAELRSDDMLVTWKLDRLGRSLGHLIQLIKELDARAIGFQSLSENIDTTNAGGRLIFHVMGALAEFERSLISERTKAGLEAARRRGKTIGRPCKLAPEQVIYARKLLATGVITTKALAADLEVSPLTLSRALNRMILASKILNLR